MPKLLEINTSFQAGGAGKVARGIAEAASNGEWHVLAAHSARFAAPLPPGVEGFCIGSKSGEYLHFLSSWAGGRHGFGAQKATRRLIAKIQDFRPDLIHLHNLHGYYLNIRILFDYLRQCGVPLVWTLHDLWPLTGRCASPQAADCGRFLSGCQGCPTLRNYPASMLDRSRHFFKQKGEIFAGVPNLHLVAMSKWMAGLLPHTCLKDYPLHIIPNGIDTDIFSPGNGVSPQSGMILALSLIHI